MSTNTEPWDEQECRRKAFAEMAERHIEMPPEGRKKYEADYAALCGKNAEFTAAMQGDTEARTIQDRLLLLRAWGAIQNAINSGDIQGLRDVARDLERVLGITTEFTPAVVVDAPEIENNKQLLQKAHDLLANIWTQWRSLLHAAGAEQAMDEFHKMDALHSQIAPTLGWEINPEYEAAPIAFEPHSFEGFTAPCVVTGGEGIKSGILVVSSAEGVIQAVPSAP